MDYADYHASLAGLDQQGPDVLHEVIISLLEKDPKKMKGLYDKVKGSLRELDFYILRMIKLNCHSMTSPYRYRYRQPEKDDNQQTDQLYYEIDDTPQQDRKELICARYDVVREVLETLDFAEVEKDVFRWKFFLNNTWRQWKGPESKDQLQRTYKSILTSTIYHVEMRRRAYIGHIIASKQRMEEIRNMYRRTLFPAAYNYSNKYHRAEGVYRKYSEKLNRITGKTRESSLQA